VVVVVVVVLNRRRLPGNLAKGVEA
jgi:hypothetical protein